MRFAELFAVIPAVNNGWSFAAFVILVVLLAQLRRFDWRAGDFLDASD
jgi:hypothetical protein